MKIVKNKILSFTLLELIAVIVIIGILAGIMVPSYNRARERAVDKQAKSVLSLLRAAERSYKMRTGSYLTALDDVPGINSALNLDLIDDGNWEYSISDDGTGFVATMTRNRLGYNRQWTITADDVNATCTGTCP